MSATGRPRRPVHGGIQVRGGKTCRGCRATRSGSATGPASGARSGQLGLSSVRPQAAWPHGHVRQSIFAFPDLTRPSAEQVENTIAAHENEAGSC